MNYTQRKSEIEQPLKKKLNTRALVVAIAVASFIMVLTLSI